MPNRDNPKRRPSRLLLFRPCTAALIAIVVLTPAGCVTGREFLIVATPAVQDGVSQIVNGLLDGLFAAIEPDPTAEP